MFLPWCWFLFLPDWQIKRWRTGWREPLQVINNRTSNLGWRGVDTENVSVLWTLRPENWDFIVSSCFKDERHERWAGFVCLIASWCCGLCIIEVVIHQFCTESLQVENGKKDCIQFDQEIQLSAQTPFSFASGSLWIPVVVWSHLLNIFHSKGTLTWKQVV